MTKKKIVYLTIDDGPSINMKIKADFLYKHNIPAIWFLIGQNVEDYPELGEYLIKKGFTIGNHSYSHQYFSELSLEQIFEEIRKTDVIIKNLYLKCGISKYPKIFKFPYSDKGDLYIDDSNGFERIGKQRKVVIQHFLYNLGYRQGKFPKITYDYLYTNHLFEDVDWFNTFDTMDYALFVQHPIFGKLTLKDIFNRIDENSPEEGRGLNYFDSEDIILMHDHSQTDKMFISIIQYLLNKGIVFRSPF